MEDQFSRTEMLIGAEGVDRLANARIAVFGIGGVGGYAVEALARSGIGALDLIDHDTVSVSNINRQILADHSTLGKQKTEVARERIARINPRTAVRTYPVFYLPEENGANFDFTQYDYIIDAIDTVTGKIGLVLQARAAGVPIISAMGAGNKMDPAAFCVSDIYQTSGCPLAKIMRHELRKRGIERLKVVYSSETPVRMRKEMAEKEMRQPPGSIAFVPSVVGLIMAGEAVKDIIGFKKETED